MFDNIETKTKKKMEEMLVAEKGTVEIMKSLTSPFTVGVVAGQLQHRAITVLKVKYIYPTIEEKTLTSLVSIIHHCENKIYSLVLH